MTHVHEWKLMPDWKDKVLWFRCRHCGTEMEIDQAERRLNTVDGLGEVLTVLEGVVDSFPDGNPPHPTIKECMDAYGILASALEESPTT